MQVLGDLFARYTFPKGLVTVSKTRNALRTAKCSTWKDKKKILKIKNKI